MDRLQKKKKKRKKRKKRQEKKKKYVERKKKRKKSFASLSLFCFSSEKKKARHRQNKKTKNTTDAMLSPPNSRRAIAATFLLLSLACWALLGASVASASTGSSPSGQCLCSDVRPRSGGIDFELGPTCAEVQAKGNCNEGYMQKTIAEMKGAPYCQVLLARKRERGKKEKREGERENSTWALTFSPDSF